MKVHSGILLSPATCSLIGPALLDFLAGWRVSGLQAPQDVRTELEEVAELGRRYQAAQLAKRAAHVRMDRSDEHPFASGCSPVVPLPAMTYSTAQVASALGIGCRAAQRRAERGSLPAVRVGRELRFAKADIDRIARKETA